MRCPDACPQEAEVVVDLGDRANGGARVVPRGLLLDRNRGRESLDRVHVGFLHEPEELTGVGGERLDVAALPLGVDRVERERRLPDRKSTRLNSSHGYISYAVFCLK